MIPYPDICSQNENGSAILIDKNSDWESRFRKARYYYPIGKRQKKKFTWVFYTSDIIASNVVFLTMYSQYPWPGYMSLVSL